MLLKGLRCDHPARQPLAFQVRTADGVTVYLPGDTIPFPDMADLPAQPPHPRSLSPRERVGSDEVGDRVGVDIVLWMGTALADGAEIARLVRPKVLLTYAITPAAAGARAKGILTQLTPGLEFQALERNHVFVYPPPS